MTLDMDILPPVAEALSSGAPVVALESTIISHGMPYPQNVETAKNVEDAVREEGAATPEPVAAAPAAAPTPAAAAPAAAAGPVDDGSITINAPMVGTFYAKANPESEPFVQVGQMVTPDTIVCIVEAMKVFNEIKAEVSGRITKVLVNNAEAVEYEQPLSERMRTFLRLEFLFRLRLCGCRPSI